MSQKAHNDVTFSQFVRIEILSDSYQKLLMGLFKKLFKESEPREEKILPWQALETLNQIEEIRKRSFQKTQIIFKHSTRCGISRMVLNQFVEQYDLDIDHADLYFLDLLSFRQVSDEVGYSFQVLHESPQLIIIKEGNAVAHASHGAINAMEIHDLV